MNIGRWAILICGIALWGCRQPDATIRRLMQSEGKPARAVLRALDSIPDVTLLNDEDWHAYLYLRAKARYELKRIQRRDTVLVETMEYFNAKGKPAQAGLLALCTGRAYASAKNYDQALHYDLEAERLAQQGHDTLLLLRAFYEQGHLCTEIGDVGNATRHFNEMILAMDRHPDWKARWEVSHLFLDVGNALLYLNRYKEASQCFGMLSDNILESLDSTIAASALYKMAYALDKLEQDRESMAYALRSLHYTTNHRERLRNLLLIADLHRQKGDMDSLSLMLSQTEGQLTDGSQTEQAGYYWLQAMFHKEKKNYSQALESLLQYVTIMDATTAPRMRIREDRYRGHYEQMQAQIRYLKERNRGMLIFCISFFAVILLGVVAYNLYRRSKKQKKLLSERTKILQDMVSSNLLFMRKLTKIQTHASDQNLFFLQRLDDVFFDGTRKIIDNREKICNAIDLLYDNFRPRLKTAYPDLNEQEIELCCLMRANIDTKDIATLIGQSVYSVQKRRTTIRKKLAMEEGADIIRFLETRLYNA